MFEKEAKERAIKLEESQTLGVYDNDEDLARDIAWNEGKVSGYEDGFKDGAEFSYNKANEWHEIEKENAELKEKISVLLSCKNCPENKGGWICVKEYENKCLSQKIEFIKELEKENTELKGIKDIATLIRANNDTVITLIQLNNILVSKNQQLTKAKEIIKDYMTIVKGDHTEVCGVPEENRTIYVLKLNEEAEQFIREEEK